MLDVLFLRRLPKLRFFFMISMSILTVVISFFCGLGILAVFVGLGIIGIVGGRHLGNLVPTIRANVNEDMNGSELALKAMMVMRETGYDSIMSKPHWAQKVDDLVEWCVAKRMGLFETMISFSLHASLLSLPFVALIGTLRLGNSSWNSSLDHSAVFIARAKKWQQEIPREEVTLSEEAIFDFNQLAGNEIIQTKYVSMRTRRKKSSTPFVRASAKTVLHQLHSISWKESNEWAYEKGGQRRVFVGGVGVLFDSAHDWREHRAFQECLEDLAVIFRMYAFCSIGSNAKEFEQWSNTQMDSCRLLEEVSREFALEKEHREQFCRILGQDSSIRPEAIISMALTCRMIKEVREDFSNRGGFLDKEEGMGAGLVRSVYHSIRKLVDADHGNHSTETDVIYPAERDLEALEELAESNWGKGKDIDFQSEYVSEIVSRLAEIAKERERLRSGLEKSLKKEGRVTVSYPSASF